MIQVSNERREEVLADNAWRIKNLQNVFASVYCSDVLKVEIIAGSFPLGVYCYDTIGIILQEFGLLSKDLELTKKIEQLEEQVEELEKELKNSENEKDSIADELESIKSNIEEQIEALRGK